MNILGKLIKDISANKRTQFWVFFAVLILLSLFMVLIYGPVYAHPGYDYYFHLTRFEALITALKEGTFPYYIDHAAALNYGYLSKVFYSDIVLVPFACLGMLVGATPAYEVMLFTMTILCGVFMYSLIATVYKNYYGAFIGAILYTFCLYRLFDVYNRGALGEVFAFTFIPLVFLGLYHIIKGDHRKWYIIAIGFSLLIFSHVISTVLTFITVLIVLLVYYKSFIKEPKRIVFLIFGGLLTLALTATYIFPLVEQIQSNTFRYESNDWTLPSRAKLPLEYVIWAVACGFTYPKDIVIVGIGILLFAGIFLRIFVKEKSTGLKSVDVGVLIGLFYIFASSFLFPWGRFPFTLLSFIQYPSRLYLFVSFFFAIATGYYLSRIFIRQGSRIIATVVIIACIGVTSYLHSENYKYMYKTYIKQTNETANEGNFFYLNGAEYVPDRVVSAYSVQERGDMIISLNDDTRISNITRENNVLHADVELSRKDSLELPLFYYKGYMVKLNDKALETTQSKNGLLQIPVDESGKIEAYYAGTTTQRISWYITLFSLLLLSFYICYQYKIRKIKK